MIAAQLNLVVRDMQASRAFYRRLGLAIEPAAHPDWADHHASVTLPNGVRLELDSAAFARQWNPGLRDVAGGAVVIMFEVPTRRDVDDVYERMVAGGARVQKSPEDAFWGARYAIIEDPDGNSIGITSPIDAAARRRPPAPPPHGA